MTSYYKQSYYDFNLVEHCRWLTTVRFTLLLIIIVIIIVSIINIPFVLYFSTQLELDICYIDFGNYDTVPCSKVHSILGKFCDKPIQAFKCKLHGVYPLGVSDLLAFFSWI